MLDFLKKLLLLEKLRKSRKTQKYMSNQENQKLTELCNTIEGVIGDGMDWVSENAEHDKQKVTLYNLKKYRRAARRYKRAIPKRPSIAIFGQSQVGKSYLVSNFAKTPEADSLEVVIPDTGERVDFIEKINPPGGGKEATGLVSRFTIDEDWKQGQQPYVLKLFSQADIAKIITNGYMSDITHYQYAIDRDAVRKTLESARKSMMQNEMPGFDEDDVYEYKEYLNFKFRDHFIIKDLNNIDFWDDIAEIVPYIEASKRWEIFEILWGKQPFFTDLFKRLSFGLAQIGFLSVVRCELAALTPQLDTILDVERLREFYSDVDKPKINLYNDNSLITTLDRSIVSALTAEAVLPLPKETADHPQRAFLKDADVLDFPGARSRQQIPEETFEEKPNDDKLLVFLRGKVAFLFDRYNFNYEISTLLFCMDNKQPEVADLPQFLYEWIKTTHGGTPKAREERERMLASLVHQNDIEKLIPLLVVFTKFNIELAGNPATEKPGDLGPHNAKWTARVGANFADQMGISVGDKWIEQWDTRESFKNLFCLRDPKWSKTIYDGLDEYGAETSIKPEYAEKMKDMEKSFVNHKDIKKYFHKPQEAWEECTDLNKPGTDYIIKYLTPTCDPIIKTEQIRSQIIELQQDLHAELSNFYQGGNIEEKLKKARINAAQVFMGLMKMQKDKNTFGNFIDRLVISDDLSWKIYFDLMMSKQIDLQEKTQTEAKLGRKTVSVDLVELLNQFIDIEDGEAPESILTKLKGYFGIDDNEALTQILEDSGVDICALIEAKNDTDNPQEVRDRAFIFSENLLGKWLEHIESLKSEDVLWHLGLQKKIADLIIKELDKNKNRVNLKKIIADNAREHVENFQLTGNIDVVARISANIINGFVNTLGWKHIAEADRPKVKANDPLPVFTEKNIKSPEKKDLLMGIEFPGERYFVEWTAGMRNSFEANVYFEEKVKDEEKAQADAKLGSLLEKVAN